MISQAEASHEVVKVTQANDAEAIHTLLIQYFDGLFYCDSMRLREVLHPSALYATVIDNKLRQLTMEEYWPIVDARVAPASKNETRYDKIIDIDILGSTTAFAKVECALSPNFYTDCLSLIRLGNRWWIIAKVFQMEDLFSKDELEQ